MHQFIQQLTDVCGGFSQFMVGLGLLILYLITTFLYGCAKSALAEAEQAAHRWKDREVDLVSELKERDETIKNLIEDNQYLRTALDRAVEEEKRSRKICLSCGSFKRDGGSYCSQCGAHIGQGISAEELRSRQFKFKEWVEDIRGDPTRWISAAEKKKIYNGYFPPPRPEIRRHKDQVIRLFKDEWIRQNGASTEVYAWSYCHDLNIWRFQVDHPCGTINFKLPNWLVLAGLIEQKFDHSEYRGCRLEGLDPYIILRTDGRLAGPLIGRTNDGRMYFHKPANPATAKEMATWLGKYADSDGKLGAKFLTENDDFTWRIAKSTDEKMMADYWLYCGSGTSGGWSWPAPFWTNIQS